MATLTIPLITVTVRRDAMSITPMAIPPYERAMLNQLFGKENVNGDALAGHMEVEPGNEYQRMIAKYGYTKVAKVWGEDDGERLIELVERASVRVVDEANPTLVLDPEKFIAGQSAAGGRLVKGAVSGAGGRHAAAPSL